VCPGRLTAALGLRVFSQAASSDAFTDQDQDKRNAGKCSAHEEDEPILTLQLLVYRHDSPRLFGVQSLVTRLYCPR
jgi:hypothetical protein